MITEGKVAAADSVALLTRTKELFEQRLGAINRQAPSFAAAFCGYRTALGAGDTAKADGLVSWLGGEPTPP